ncbi:conserved hypothetical protein [Verticillium alfalfae VaMs.102]|uniref:DUF5672 domain-containing protein n=1 Tax=Verticillium alfalfae (strain VaMs.102 / ATCC MYA-4576 / FGSC 10136) TaxID=526221 RepID=C9SE97_VERA1|nr:conserved hypothetical protein [Verticillium alfalfae VaMs.102]EEY16490.1 conserved hypothetical protein [Verticillium alfalfae VaMs.102]
MTIATSKAGNFAITKNHLLLALSLVLTWWFAHILPHYQPAIKAGLSSRLQQARQKIPSIKVDWNPSADPRARFNQSKVALMIEPRVIPHLVPQILHMSAVAPPDWRFLFIGSNESVVSVARSFAIKNQQVVGKLDLMVLPEPWQIDTKEHVYRLLTDMRFYDEFLPGIEWILKYEHDSILCSNSNSSLNEWLHWSWAGASRTVDDRFSGNGGLSLRRVSAIRRVLKIQERYNDTDPEDEWFGRRMWILPNAKVAAKDDGVLAVEDVYKENPMGFHVRDGGQFLTSDVWKNATQRQNIFNYCPELSLIMNMKLERERCPGDDHEGHIGPTPSQIAAAQMAKIKQEEKNRLKQEEELRKAEEAKKKQSLSGASDKTSALPQLSASSKVSVSLATATATAMATAVI